MNQIIFQTPNVEKIHQTQQQNPEQFQRFIHHEEQSQIRKHTETVQTPVQTENSRELESDGKKREHLPGKKKKRSRAEDESAELSADEKNGAGSIVDVVI
jgi:hypothetical protein